MVQNRFGRFTGLLYGESDADRALIRPWEVPGARCGSWSRARVCAIASDPPDGA